MMLLLLVLAALAWERLSVSLKLVSILLVLLNCSRREVIPSPLKVESMPPSGISPSDRANDRNMTEVDLL
jgi:hypothetical protein